MPAGEPPPPPTKMPTLTGLVPGPALSIDTASMSIFLTVCVGCNWCGGSMASSLEWGCCATLASPRPAVGRRQTLARVRAGRSQVGPGDRSFTTRANLHASIHIANTNHNTPNARCFALLGLHGERGAGAAGPTAGDSWHHVEHPDPFHGPPGVRRAGRCRQARTAAL